MNKEELKVDLLAMIKEAQNLDESALGEVPYSSVRVNKNKVKAFDRKAANYFELSRNFQLTDNETRDYAKEVYDELVSLVQEENREYYDSLVFEIVSANKSCLQHLTYLNNSLDEINKRLDALAQRKQQLTGNQNSMPNEEYTKRINDIEGEIGQFSEHRSKIKQDIIVAKKMVNELFKKKIQDEIKFIEESYSNTYSGTNIDFSEYNGQAILARDKDKYDCLQKLLIILDNVDDNLKVVSFWDAVCVNEEQLEEVEEIFAKVDFLEHFKPNYKVPKDQNDNSELVQKLEAYLAEMREDYEKAKKISNTNVRARKSDRDGKTVLVDKIDEYNRINDIIIMLKNKSEQLVNVWGIGSVDKSDIESFKELVNATEYFKDKIPIRETNKKRLAEVEARMKELSKEVKDSNEAKAEYDYLNEIRTYLLNANVAEKVELLDNGIELASKDIRKYKKAENKLRDIPKKIINPNLNQDKLKEIEDRIKVLVDNAEKESDSNKKVEFAGYTILSADKDELINLAMLGGILARARKSNDLADDEGIMVDRNDVLEYKERKAKLEEIKKEKSEPVVPENGAKKEELKKKIPELNGAKIKELEKEISKLNGETGTKYGLLCDFLSILKNVKENDDLIEIDDVIINRDQKLFYDTTINSLKNLIKKDSSRHKFSIRQMKDSVKSFWQNNRKKVAVAGLCISLGAVSLTFGNPLLGLTLPQLLGFGGAIGGTVLGKNFFKKIKEKVSDSFTEKFSNIPTQTERASAIIAKNSPIAQLANDYVVPSKEALKEVKDYFENKQIVDDAALDAIKYMKDNKIAKDPDKYIDQINSSEKGWDDALDENLNDESLSNLLKNLNPTLEKKHFTISLKDVIDDIKDSAKKVLDENDSSYEKWLRESLSYYQEFVDSNKTKPIAEIEDIKERLKVATAVIRMNPKDVERFKEKTQDLIERLINNEDVKEQLLDKLNFYIAAVASNRMDRIPEIDSYIAFLDNSKKIASEFNELLEQYRTEKLSLEELVQRFLEKSGEIPDPVKEQIYTAIKVQIQVLTQKFKDGRISKEELEGALDSIKSLAIANDQVIMDAKKALKAQTPDNEVEYLDDSNSFDRVPVLLDADTPSANREVAFVQNGDNLLPESANGYSFPLSPENNLIQVALDTFRKNGNSGSGVPAALDSDNNFISQSTIEPLMDKETQEFSNNSELLTEEEIKQIISGNQNSVGAYQENGQPSSDDLNDRMAELREKAEAGDIKAAQELTQLYSMAAVDNISSYGRK